MANPAPLRVLVVDDSAYNRRSITEILSHSPQVEVVGKAANGEEALQLVSQLKPDAITLDLEMPKMDGYTFLRILMAKQPTPVIVISSYSAKENVFKALELGAVDFVAKPSRQLVPEPSIRREIVQKILLVRYLRPLALSGIRSTIPMPAVTRPPSSDNPSTRSPAVLKYIIGIASSTGGPTALLELIGRIPERFPGAILIAQHMPDKFTRTFAERLDRRGALRVFEAQDGDLVLPRRAFVCPGKMCMELVLSAADIRLRVTPAAPGDRYVPSGDRLLRSIAEVGSRSIGIILTGMGDDGVVGARAIRAAGGMVIAESEETAVVYGMPRAAARAGVVNETRPLPSIGDFLAQLA